MSDDLRTSIAKILHQRFGPSLGAHPDGWYREPNATREEYLADADAVIREFGPLVRYWDKDFKELHYCRECGGWGPME